MVLLKLNRSDQLAAIDHDYRNGPDPQCKRAWEIVNDIEGYQPFIAERGVESRREESRMTGICRDRDSIDGASRINSIP